MGAGVVFFDLDGTLLPRTSTGSLLAERFGYGHLIEELNSAYSAGQVSNHEVAHLSAPWFAGRSLVEVDSVLSGAPWIDGIDEVTARLREASVIPVLATVAWEFSARLVAERFGFAAWCGTLMLETEGSLDGMLARPCEASDKARFVAQFCSYAGVPLHDAVAVGDSRSDLPTFNVVGRSIALNADDDARHAATKAVDTADLSELLPLLS